MIHHVVHAALDVAGFFWIFGIICGAIAAKIIGSFRRRHGRNARTA